MRRKRCSASTLRVMLQAIADLGLGFGAYVLCDLGEICWKQGGRKGKRKRREDRIESTMRGRKGKKSHIFPYVR